MDRLRQRQIACHPNGSLRQALSSQSYSKSLGISVWPIFQVGEFVHMQDGKDPNSVWGLPQ